MKKSTRDEIRKWVITIFEIGLIVFAIIGLNALINSISLSESASAYILCNPGNYATVRSEPCECGDEIGILETGNCINVTGETENGFVKFLDSKGNECWVYVGYVTTSKPRWMNGRISTVKDSKCISSTVNMAKETGYWIEQGTKLQVFWYTDKWCVTNRGYVMTKHIEIGGA